MNIFRIKSIFYCIFNYIYDFYNITVNSYNGTSKTKYFKYD